MSFTEINVWTIIIDGHITSWAQNELHKVNCARAFPETVDDDHFFDIEIAIERSGELTVGGPVVHCHELKTSGSSEPENWEADRYVYTFEASGGMVLLPCNKHRPFLMQFVLHTEKKIITH